MIKALDIWLPAWRRREKYSQHALGTRHVMIAICDHYEPFHGVGKPEAVARVEAWQRDYPKLIEEFRDADGIAPRYSFFYPIEQYDADIVGRLADLCAATGSETEIHLHHDNDTAENLRRTLEQGVERFASHGLLSRDGTGALRYGFIHGNWALDNSHPHGRHCGVNNELRILRQTGCYADFTLPSAPERTQTHTINSVYYARGTDRPKSHDRGRRVRADRDPQQQHEDELLIVQGPLALNWQRKKFGFLPRIENSDLTAVNPPTLERFRLWLDCQVAVEGRPNWVFVKLHTHGAKPENTRMLLGEPMREFHRSLAKLAAKDRTICFHYVTARELVNILHAAEAGHSGNPGQFRDFRYRRVTSGQTEGSMAESRP
ncbi:hypothetical protein [Chthoniobacter flavus]|nr:hypothetical protein [Chthoniobacter flavus]